MKRKIINLMSVGLLAFGLGACVSDDDEAYNRSTTTTTRRTIVEDPMTGNVSTSRTVTGTSGTVGGSYEDPATVTTRRTTTTTTGY